MFFNTCFVVFFIIKKYNTLFDSYKSLKMWIFLNIFLNIIFFLCIESLYSILAICVFYSYKKAPSLFPCDKLIRYSYSIKNSSMIKKFFLIFVWIDEEPRNLNNYKFKEFLKAFGFFFWLDGKNCIIFKYLLLLTQN